MIALWILLGLLLIVVLLGGTLFLLAKFKPELISSFAKSRVGTKLIGWMMKSDSVKDKVVDIASKEIANNPEKALEEVSENMNLGRRETRLLSKKFDNMAPEEVASLLKSAESGDTKTVEQAFMKSQSPQQRAAQNRKKNKERAKKKAAKKHKKRNRK